MPNRISFTEFMARFVPTTNMPALLSVLYLFSIIPAVCHASDWPQFLGPDRSGISGETGLIDSWPKTGPREVWRIEGGVGMSGMAISNGTLVTLIQRDGEQFVVALATSSGKSIWQTAVAAEYRNSMGHGPRATPSISGNSVYAFTGQGILASLNVKSGKINWSRNGLRELNGRPAEYGMACSPLIVGTQVIVTIGAPRATVVACDLDSGKTLWTVGHDTTGYSSPPYSRSGADFRSLSTRAAPSSDSNPRSADNCGAILTRHPMTATSQPPSQSVARCSFHPEKTTAAPS